MAITLADALRGYQPPTTSALSDPIVEHFRNLPQTTAQNAINTNNMVQNAIAYDPKTGKFNEGPTFSEFANYVPNLMGATAWHGTPHKILGKFDINKVGTGEGAQAYGHGMYFAEAPAVASKYQKALSGRTDLNQQPSDPAFIHAVNSFRQAGTPLDAIPTEMKKAYKSASDKDIQLAIQATEKGNLYKVDIPDEQIPNMLDWDKPLLQQTPQVQEALAKLGIKTDKQKLSQFDDALLDALMNDANKTLPKQPINPSGQDIYQTFVQGSPQLTSQKLNEVGISGIRYKDEMSRGFDKGTSNFVIFDPSTVKILEENSKPVSRKELIQQQIDKIE